MTSKFDDDDNEKIDFDKELRQHKRTLKKYAHLDVDERAMEMEALQEAMKQTLSKSTKKREKERRQVATDLIQKIEGEKIPNKDFVDLVRKRMTGDGSLGYMEDFEPEPTGFEELPWERDED